MFYFLHTLMKTVVITSWYFNPIHPWHIECLELCKDLGDKLRVIINNDKQVRDKTWKEEVFQDETFRSRVVRAMKVVDETVLSVDQDWSVCKSIRHINKLIKERYGEDVKVIFGKWWDRFAWNIPEVKICEDLWIEIRDWLWLKTHNSSEYRNK